MIEVEHLTKYYGGFLAVDDISFTIEDGHVYGFLGPNGAGKSTTMNIITGCLSATAGAGLLVKALTRSENLAIAVGLPLMAAVVIVYFLDAGLFEGLLPDIMSALSLFERLNVFVNGVFDLTAVVFYLSVAGIVVVVRRRRVQNETV